MVATLVVVALAAVAIWASAAPYWLRIALTFAVVGWGGSAVWGMLRPPVRSLAWHADGSVDLVLRDGAPHARRDAQGSVQASRKLGPLIVLTVRWPPRERAHLWILPDNLDADTRRRLRMRVGEGGRPDLPSGNADTR